MAWYKLLCVCRLRVGRTGVEFDGLLSLTLVAGGW